ncbi:hypothetical protein NEHOM01_2309 [Nematocida homosporus]|uniref:uncharacterized protein n=1 Tax=Nematocida homosporus TaxID=1912981 RepID=UPI00221F00BB|nr:uncharacterized protein NEHOM01_2309 [Nematocida homosporus]KAI5187611.1 hypothetical protein NEHOM01_2309 [Nematocida homosporus]
MNTNSITVSQCFEMYGTDFEQTKQILRIEGFETHSVVQMYKDLLIRTTKSYFQRYQNSFRSRLRCTCYIAPGQIRRAQSILRIDLKSTPEQITFLAMHKDCQVPETLVLQCRCQGEYSPGIQNEMTLKKFIFLVIDYRYREIGVRSIAARHVDSSRMGKILSNGGNGINKDFYQNLDKNNGLDKNLDKGIDKNIGLDKNNGMVGEKRESVCCMESRNTMESCCCMRQEINILNQTETEHDAYVGLKTYLDRLLFARHEGAREVGCLKGEKLDQKINEIFNDLLKQSRRAPAAVE